MNNAEILEVTKDNALQAYDRADTAGKGLLANLFGKKHFLTKITDRITSFEDCCAETGDDPKDQRFHQGPPDEIAYRKIKVITKAYNGDWTPDWNDGAQRKWFSWWYLDAPGFRLSALDYHWSASRSGAGSRLCFSSEENCRHAANLFKSIYQTFITTDNV